MVGRAFYWLFVIPLFVIVIVFAVTNHGSTELSLWPVLTEPVLFPVYGIALIGLFIGFLYRWSGVVDTERAVATTPSRVTAAVGGGPAGNRNLARQAGKLGSERTASHHSATLGSKSTRRARGSRMNAAVGLASSFLRVMSIGVKICGLNQRSAVEAAVAGGADYLGFVFFPRSPRYVDLATAASLASLVPSGVLRVGLVVDAETDFLNSLVTTVPLDMLQLHGGESPSRVAEIRESFGLPVIKAISVGEEADFDVVSEYEKVADRLLFDARASASASSAGGQRA